MAVIGGTQITDLAVDDHACLTYGEAEERLDLTAAFVRDGLAPTRTVVLRCHPGTAARFVLLGAADVPVIRLVRAHDR